MGRYGVMCNCIRPILGNHLVKAGGWTIDKLSMFVPVAMTRDLVNPDPPQSR